MSWVPSPSPRLQASYREVIPSVLGQVPGPGGHALSPMGAIATPSALSFGMPGGVPTPQPYQAPQGMRPQTRQGSFTPAPGVQPNAAQRGMSPGLGLNFPARLGSMNNIPYTAPNLARDLAFQNRSWTPLPVPGVLAGLERPPGNPMDDKLSHSLTMLPDNLGYLGSPAPNLAGDMRLGMMNGLNTGNFSHQPKQRSFNNAPVNVVLNVYWHRPVGYDEQGRAQRNLGGNDLSWRQKFLKDVLGVYHVGVEVHGIEYTFGNYRAPGSRQVGNAGSGVFSHEPRRPGPHCVFKHAEVLGSTTVAAPQVEEICQAMGNSEWNKAAYNKIHHNCVDFTRSLSAKLGGGEIPTWCYRGAAIAKVMGYGGPEPEDNSNELSVSMIESPEKYGGSLVGPVQGYNNGYGIPTPQDPMAQRLAAMELASRSLAGTYVAPPPLAGPGALPMPALGGGRLGGSYVSPPMSGTYVAPPGPPPSAPSAQVAPVAAPGAEIAANSRVSVQQNNGTWLEGRVVCQDYDNLRYTILYDQNWSTEVNVPKNRLVPLAEDAPRGIPQGLASADSILEPLKMQGLYQGKSLGGISGGIRPNMNGLNGRGPGGIPAWPSFAAQAPPPAPNLRPGIQPRPMPGSFGQHQNNPMARPNGQHNGYGQARPGVPQVGMQRSQFGGRDTLGGTWRGFN